MNKIVFGCDVSSSCIGYCALEVLEDSSIKHLSSGFVKPLKEGDIIARIADTRNIVRDIIEQIKPTHIGIEDIIKFMKGKSNADSIIMLTTFNRMIGLLSFDYLNDLPRLFNVMSIRHGLKLNKKLPAKEDMPELVAQHLGIQFPYYYSKKGKIETESYDRADGIAVALYYALILTGKIKPKAKVIKKSKTDKLKDKNLKASKDLKVKKFK